MFFPHKTGFYNNPTNQGFFSAHLENIQGGPLPVLGMGCNSTYGGEKTQLPFIFRPFVSGSVTANVIQLMIQKW